MAFGKLPHEFWVGVPDDVQEFVWRSWEWHNISPEIKDEIQEVTL